MPSSALRAVSAILAAAASTLFGVTTLAAAPLPAGTGPVQFAEAKLLAFDGRFAEAAAAFEAAIAAGPDDAYLHLEFATALARMASHTRGPERVEQLRRAAVEADAARRLDPGNADILRVVGQVGITLAAEDPAAANVARGAFEELHQQRPDDPQALVALGQVQMGQGRFAEAAENFRLATLLRPDQRLAFSLLIEALLQAEQPAAATAALRDLVSKFPDALDQRLRLARLLGEDGKDDEALGVLRTAPAEQAEEGSLRRALALAQYRTGDLEGALQSLDVLLAGERDDRSAQYLRAVVLASLARNDEALRVLEQLQRAAPRSADIARLMARVRERTGDWRGAAALLGATAERLEQQTATAQPAPGADESSEPSESSGSPTEAAAELAAEIAEVRLESAAILSRAEQWKEAESVLRVLLAAGDEDVRTAATLAIADAMAARKDVPGALALLQSHDASWARGKTAELLLRAGRPAEARPLLQSLGDGGVTGLFLAAEACQRAEAYAEAVPWLERAMAAAPESPEATFQLAAAYERVGRRAEAITAFEGLLERSPDFAPALNYLGYMWAERGERLPEAVELTSRALRLDPDNGAYADSVGWAHFQRGDLEAARTYLERAAGLMPPDATVLEHLGDVYAARGDAAKAVAVYRRALDLKEDNAVAVERKLQSLRKRS